VQFSGAVVINAPRDKVWEFVTDPEKVGQCGPGVESIVKVDDSTWTATAKVGVGFISARFQGKLQMDDLDPPNRATLKASGQAPGSAADALAVMVLKDGDEPGTTLMDWDAQVAISGTLASVGARLIEGTANKLVGQTFDCIKSRLEGSSG
jgi:carbon monoxide dehydrogenase subunit G